MELIQVAHQQYFRETAVKKVLVDERLVHPGTGAVLLPNEVTIRQNVETGEVVFVARCGHAHCDSPFLVINRPPGVNAQRVFEVIERAMAEHNAKAPQLTLGHKLHS